MASLYGEVTANLRVDRDVLESTLDLALEICREGREGRRIGTLFTVGDPEAVMTHSRPLILDPLLGHPESARHVTNPDLRGTIKELAQLDGAFVVSDTGVFLSACRYLEASTTVNVPLGLGSRHLAAAAITKLTRCAAIVVSESSMVRLFDDGAMLAEMQPEIWVLRRHQSMLRR